MRRTGVALFLAATLAAAAGCSASDAAPVASSSVPPKDIPPCSDLYKEGLKITKANFRLACVTDHGDLISPRPVELTCADDRELYWNDLAWGYVGDAMHLTPEDDPSKMPTDAVDKCLEGTTGPLDNGQ